MLSETWLTRTGKKGRNIEKYGICKEYREVVDTHIYGFQKRDIKASVGAD